MPGQAELQHVKAAFRKWVNASLRLEDWTDKTASFWCEKDWKRSFYFRQWTAVLYRPKKVGKKAQSHRICCYFPQVFFMIQINSSDFFFFFLHKQGWWRNITVAKWLNWHINLESFLFIIPYVNRLTFFLMLSVFFVNPGGIDAWNAELPSQVLVRERVTVHE